MATLNTIINRPLQLSNRFLPVCRACLKDLTQFGNINRVYSVEKKLHSTNYETKDESIVNSFPSSVQPYLRLVRLDRPIGSWLLFWPCSWSIALAAEGGEFPSLSMLAIFGVGSLVMRGAGCTINDMWDRDFDKEVFRTASRPMASGLISQPKALIFLAVQLSMGLGILLSLNNYSIALGAASVPLVVLYPLMKRFTFWPQAVLGLTINWGAFLGYSAVKGYCDWSVCLPLYAACVSWTLLYDTIYSYQDKADDIKLRLKSTAILFGDHPKKWLSGFGLLISSSSLLVGLNASMTWPYYVGLGLVSSHLAWQIHSVNIHDPVDCLNKFRSNSHIGIILLLSIITATLIKS